MEALLLETQNRVRPYIHRTPVLTSRMLNEIAGCELYFKCENFQRMGAFKIRGAINAIMQLSDGQKQRGVVTHSSGNFAQALSLAASSLSVKAYVVMPSTAPQVKKDAVKGYGGEIIECKPTMKAREATAAKIVEEKGATLVHSSNDLNVILGQATATMELLEDYPDLNYVFAPVGGGGLVAGTILAAKHFGSNCRVVGGEPTNMDDAYRSLKAGEIDTFNDGDTIADGLKTKLGNVNFPIIKQDIEKITRVSEQEIIDAMRLIWERMKIVVEPSGVVPLAALLQEKAQYQGKKCGIILSGGNVDLRKLPF